MRNTEDQLDVIIGVHLRYLEGDGPAPDFTTLAPELRNEAQARVQVLEAAWGASIEVPTEDPVARRFGFDRSGQVIAIDGRRIAQLRKAARMDLNVLLGLITAAGGEISAGNLFRVEQNRAATVSQPVASAIVAALHTTLAEIETTDGGPESDPMRVFLSGPRFSDIIDDWARRFSRQVDEVRSLVAGRALAAQYRAEDVTDDHLAEIVRAILASLEP